MNTSKERKETPVFSGVLQYFPDAINAVARQSWAGNEKHNPGEPLHWAREKSSDHMDCAIRHMMTPNEIDPETGGTHLVAAAWRILAALQLQQEALAERELVESLSDGVPIEEAFDLPNPISTAWCDDPCDKCGWDVGRSYFKNASWLCARCYMQPRQTETTP